MRNTRTAYHVTLNVFIFTLPDRSIYKYSKYKYYITNNNIQRPNVKIRINECYVVHGTRVTLRLFATKINPKQNRKLLVDIMKKLYIYNIVEEMDFEALTRKKYFSRAPGKFLSCGSKNEAFPDGGL